MNANIARHLDLMAAAQPATPALKVPRGRTADGGIDYLVLDFAALRAEADAWCARLAGAGVARGDRVLVMVRPGLPLIASVFAQFKLGAVPVVIDPGMGLRSFLSCVARSRPRVLVGIPLARVVSRVFRRAFASVEVRVPVSGSLTARLAAGGRGGAATGAAMAGGEGQAEGGAGERGRARSAGRNSWRRPRRTSSRRSSSHRAQPGRQRGCATRTASSRRRCA